MGRRFKIAAVSLMAATLLVGMERTPVPSSLCRFVESYQAIKNTHAPLGIFERLLYSAALSRQRASECKISHGTA